MRPATSTFPQALEGLDFETSPARRFGEVSNTLLETIAEGFEPVVDDGTPYAIDYCRSGVAANSVQRSQRGGAHNCAARQSHALTSAQIVNLKAAEGHAALISLPFTRMITIHWEAAGVPLAGMANATGRFIDLLSKTASRHGLKTSWLWVHEGGETKGGHCHLLVHVPAKLVPIITKLQRRWLRKITGRVYRKGVIKSRPIGGTLGLESGNPNLLASNRAEALSYVLKGASELAGQKHDLTRREPGGLVIGKRCGTSQNIGSKARKLRAATDREFE